MSLGLFSYASTLCRLCSQILEPPHCLQDPLFKRLCSRSKMPSPLHRLRSSAAAELSKSSLCRLHRCNVLLQPHRLVLDFTAHPYPSSTSSSSSATKNFTVNNFVEQQTRLVRSLLVEGARLARSLFHQHCDLVSS